MSSLEFSFTITSGTQQTTKVAEREQAITGAILRSLQTQNVPYFPYFSNPFK